MNRAVDERILPEPLVRSDNGRRFTRLGAVLASFYFKTEGVYVAHFRRQVVLQIVDQIRSRVARLEAIYNVSRELPTEAWRIDVRGVTTGAVRVDLGFFVHEATSRMEEIERAGELISSDREVMGGAPVFTGTRIPIDPIVASLNKGIERARILKAYPSLTDGHLDAAKVYTDVHPRRGRPSKSSIGAPSWKVKSSRRVEGTGKKSLDERHDHIGPANEHRDKKA